MVGMDAAVVLTTLAAAVPTASAGADAAQRAAERPQPSPRPAQTLGTAIRRAHLAGDLSWGQRVEYEAHLAAARRAARRLPAARAREVRGALAVAERMAASGRLGAERLVPVMAAVTATTDVLRLRAFPRPAQRLAANGDGLVYEFRPGSGVQPHPLASAGRLNALADACLHARRAAPCRPAAMGRAADSLLELAVRDGRRLRMEYTFPFGTGRPPWTSAMAQATAAQALARAGRVTSERRHVRGATALFRGLVADGPAVRAGGRVERFAMYSFQPSMRVLNGELQTLVGLADYARLSGRRVARRVLRRTARALADELPVFDTGAWTLYAAGGREATLHYHRLTERFAARACRRALGRAFCGAAARYARYTREPPQLTLRAPDTVRAGRRVTVTLSAGKLATGALVVGGPHGSTTRHPVQLGRNATTLQLTPARPGRWRLTLTATAVNGKRTTTRTEVRATPKPRPAPSRADRRAREERARSRERAERRARKESAERRATKDRAERRAREDAERREKAPADPPNEQTGAGPAPATE